MHYVFIATSLDGYIADKEGKLDWLHSIANPDKLDCGFSSFMSRMDAIVMGRNTFQAVDSFDCGWPYTKPAFVLFRSMIALPAGYENKAELICGSTSEVIKAINIYI